MNLKDYIAGIQDYPIEGVLFRDITPLLQSGDAFAYACDQIKKFAQENGADVIVGPESRGFIFGCPVAKDLNIGFVPVRKPNKLPRETISLSYDLEYGSNVLEMHKDAIKEGMKVVVVDDLLATGGTIHAVNKMVESLGGEVVGCCFLIELLGLNGREMLKDYNVHSILSYE